MVGPKLGALGDLFFCLLFCLGLLFEDWDVKGVAFYIFLSFWILNHRRQNYFQSHLLSG
jgi:hypothetical protein